MTTFNCGAKRSEKKPMYHKIPARPLRRLAERYTLGSKYDDPAESTKISGKQNWKKGDEEFYTDAFGHLIEHLYLFADGDRTDDHIAAAAWGCFALMEAQEEGIIE
jgi:hypothetical protein